MSSTTSTTRPLSYYEVLSTFWAAARTACGTDLRGESLVNLDVFGPMPHGFVVELGSKLRPAGIEHGLGQAGSGQSRGIDIADADAPVLPHESGRQLMQEMPPTVCDPGVDSPHARPMTGTLRDRECPLVLSVEPRCLDFLAGRERRQEFQPEINADLADPVVPVFRNLNLQIQIPAAASILRKAPTANFPLNWTAEPEPIAAPEEHYAVAANSCRARGLKGDPAQGLSTAPSRPLAVGISRERKLLADRLNRVRVQAQELAATRGQPDQIETRGPLLVVPASSLLDFAAIVPDAIHRPSLSQKMPTGGRILDPVSIGQHHTAIVLDGCYKLKTDAKHFVGIFTLDFASGVPAITKRVERRDSTVVRKTPSWDAPKGVRPAISGYRESYSRSAFCSPGTARLAARRV